MTPSRISRRTLAACVYLSFLAFAFLASGTLAFSAATQSNTKTQKNTPATKAAPATKTNPATYKGAIVMNAETGETLFQDNPDVVNPPASVTKLMTFLLVDEAIASGKISLTTPVGVTKQEAKFAMKPGSTSVWLNEKETFPVEELLYAMIIRSANDAALVLSRAVAGSSEAFVTAMNARAKELGLTHTRFVTPHGLTPANVPIANGDLSSPRDIATLSRYLITNTDILKYTSVRSRPFGQGQRAKPVDMTNHNHLLGKVPGVDGLKTGFTDGAGFCIAATAERNGNRIIVVTMGSPDRFSRDAKIIELINQNFAKFTSAGRAKPAAPVTTSISSKRNATNIGIEVPDSGQTAQPSASPRPTTSPITPATTPIAPANTPLPHSPIAPATATEPSATDTSIPQITFPPTASAAK